MGRGRVGADGTGGVGGGQPAVGEAHADGWCCSAKRSPCGSQLCTMGIRRFVQARCEGTTSNPILASRLLAAPELDAHNGNWEDVMPREVRDDALENAASYKRDGSL